MNNADKPAYPFVPSVSGVIANPETEFGYEGMTKREAFAMAAMQAYCAPFVIRMDLWQRLKFLVTGKGNVPISHGDKDEVARMAIRQADELLKQLNESKD